MIKMADVAISPLVEEGTVPVEPESEVEAEVEDTQMTRGEGAEGCETSGAVCAVCRRVFTLTKAGLVRTHGPVGSRCPGSRASPASGPGVPQAPSNVPTAGLILPDPGEAEDTLILEFPLRHSTRILKRIPRGLREGEAKKLASLVEVVFARNDRPGAVFRIPCLLPSCP